MLAKELNERLTRVGAGTPMGNLLRRYWFPVAPSSELGSKPVQKVTLLGEDLVLFRTQEGHLGLLDERCPHRGTSLAYGFPDGNGLRCAYHGWKFDTAGACLEQPNQFDDNPQLRSQCGTVGHRVAEQGGLVWAYIGPEPAPALPPYDLFRREPDETCFRDIGYAVVPCNWLQIQENTLDPTHAEWLHGRYFNYVLAQQDEPPTKLGGRHVKIGFDPFQYGIIKRRLREGQAEDADDWVVGHPMVFPNLLLLGADVLNEFQVRVPIDDTHTLHLWYVYYEVPPEYRHLLSQLGGLPDAFKVPIQAPDGTMLTDNIDAQDAMAWVTQGTIADRSREHLVQGDQGIALFRKMLLEQVDRVERGEEPMCVFREVASTPVTFPHETSNRGLSSHANPLAEWLRTQGKYSPRLNKLSRLIDDTLVHRLLTPLP